MSAEEIHDSHQESQRPVHEDTVVALGEVATQDDGETPEGVWDHQKAETMAAALQDKPKKFVRDADGEIVRHENRRAVLVDAENGASLMDKSRYDTVEDYEGDVLGDIVEPAKKQLVDDRVVALRAIANDENADPYDRRHAQHDLDAFSEVANKKIENGLAPLSALYDLNPNKFADMPTRDFMELAKDYQEAVSLVEHNSARLAVFKETVERYEGMLNEGRGEPTDPDTLAAKIANLFHEFLNKTVQSYAKEHDWPADNLDSSIPYLNFHEAARFFSKELQTTLKGSFDKTPRQIIEEQLVVLKRYQELAEKSHAEDTAARQRIEDEAKSAPSA